MVKMLLKALVIALHRDPGKCETQSIVFVRGGEGGDRDPGLGTGLSASEPHLAMSL